MDNSEAPWTPVSRRRRRPSYTSTPISAILTPPASPRTPSIFHQSGAWNFRTCITNVPERFRTPRAIAGLLKQGTPTKVQESILHLFIKGSDVHMLSRTDISADLKVLAQTAGFQTSAVHTVTSSSVRHHSPTYSCVVRGVDITTPIEDVEAAIREAGLQLIRAWRIMSRVTNKYTRLVRVLTQDKRTVERLMESGLRVHFMLHSVEASQPSSSSTSGEPSASATPETSQVQTPASSSIPALPAPAPAPPSPPSPAPTSRIAPAPSPSSPTPQLKPTSTATPTSNKQQPKKKKTKAKASITAPNPPQPKPPAPVQSTSSDSKPKQHQPPTACSSPVPDNDQIITMIEDLESNVLGFVTSSLISIFPEKEDLITKVIPNIAKAIFGVIFGPMEESPAH